MANSPVSPATHKKLQEAMQRLLAGRSRHTNGALTKNNLFLEAGVSRATMNRDTALLADWEAATSNRKDQDAPDEVTVKLRSELRKSQENVRALRADLKSAVTVIQALHAENVSLREKLDRIRKKARRRNKEFF